jgi:hypothetical protein
MDLGRTEDERLLALVDPLHQHGDTLFFPLSDLDDAIEVRLGIAAALLDFTFYDVVVRRVDVVVKSGGNLHNFERRKEAVVYALFQGVDVNRLAEVGVGACSNIRGSDLHFHDLNTD